MLPLCRRPRLGKGVGFRIGQERTVDGGETLERDSQPVELILHEGKSIARPVEVDDIGFQGGHELVPQRGFFSQRAAAGNKPRTVLRIAALEEMVEAAIIRCSVAEDQLVTF